MIENVNRIWFYLYIHTYLYTSFHPTSYLLINPPMSSIMCVFRMFNSTVLIKLCTLWLTVEQEDHISPETSMTRRLNETSYCQELPLGMYTLSDYWWVMRKSGRINDRDILLSFGKGHFNGRVFLALQNIKVSTWRKSATKLLM